MADDPEQQIDPEQKLAEAVEFVRGALEGASAYAVAHDTTAPPELIAYANELIEVSTILIAIVSGQSQREVGERIFKQARGDEEWRRLLEELRRRASESPQGS